MRTFCLLFALLSLSLRVSASDVYVTDEDRRIFERYVSHITAKERMPREVIMETAKFFLDVPYVAATLEKEPEGLVVNLREMDCTTFVETVLSLSKAIIDGEPTFGSFCKNLQTFRYREGKIDGYISRLHYTTDWIYDNALKGLVKDVTAETGGKPHPVSLSFMSKNADMYRQLKYNAALTAEMAAIERKVNSRPYFMIPEDQIEANSDRIQEGDVICFVTSIDGLDISHVGLAIRVSGRLTFIHASSSRKKVIIQPGTLQEYTIGIKKNTGIMVVRPLSAKTIQKQTVHRHAGIPSL